VKNPVGEEPVVHKSVVEERVMEEPVVEEWMMEECLVSAGREPVVKVGEAAGTKPATNVPEPSRTHVPKPHRRGSVHTMTHAAHLRSGRCR
jgi:hypothetical protein